MKSFSSCRWHFLPLEQKQPESGYDTPGGQNPHVLIETNGYNKNTFLKYVRIALGAYETHRVFLLHGFLGNRILRENSRFEMQIARYLWQHVATNIPYLIF